MELALAMDLLRTDGDEWTSWRPRMNESQLIRRTYAILVSDLSESARERIHLLLREFDWYLGARQVIPSNPIHRAVLGGSLPMRWFVQGREAGYDVDSYWGDPEAGSIDWLVAGTEFKVRRPADRDMPSVLSWRDPESERDQSADRLLDQAQRSLHADLVADSLVAWARGLEPSGELSRLGELVFEAGTLIYPRVSDLEEKLAGYSLNHLHSTGSDKARVFKSALSFTGSDWRMLAFQLIDALLLSKPSKTRGRFVDEAEESIIQYHVNVACQGLNGRTAVVRAGWKIDSDMHTRLTTAYVNEAPSTDPTISPTSFLAPATLDANRFSNVWDQAHKYATQVADRFWISHIATDGRELVSQRDRMFLSVAVNMVPGSFGEWADRAGHGEVREDGVLEIAVPTQARQRALPWAEAFLRVLELNGIEGEIHFWEYVSSD
jgi:hypothetical protein